MEKLITFAVPCYNSEDYMDKCLTSLLKAGEKAQIIIVDDGSNKDNTAKKADAYQEKYPNIVKAVHKENGGHGDAVNCGLSHAEGKYFKVVDSDDWLEKDAVRKIAECASQTDADLIYFNFYREYGDKVELEVERDYDSSEKLDYQRHMYEHKAYGCVWNKCVKRSIFLDNTIHTPKFSHAEDAFLMSQVVGYADSIVHLNDYLYHYRKDNPNALTRQGRKRRCNELIRNYLYLCELYQDVQDNPVAGIMDDIFYRAGRYSLIYGLGLFDEYPYLADRIAAARIKCNAYTSVPVQLVLKLYSYFLRR
jgi:glycosyltransferase involved in cell wall biosynthesis